MYALACYYCLFVVLVLPLRGDEGQGANESSRNLEGSVNDNTPSAILPLPLTVFTLTALLLPLLFHAKPMIVNAHPKCLCWKALPNNVT